LPLLPLLPTALLLLPPLLLLLLLVSAFKLLLLPTVLLLQLHLLPRLFLLLLLLLLHRLPVLPWLLVLRLSLLDRALLLLLRLGQLAELLLMLAPQFASCRFVLLCLRCLDFLLQFAFIRFVLGLRCSGCSGCTFVLFVQLAVSADVCFQVGLRDTRRCAWMLASGHNRRSPWGTSA
jgi:hypothetical protein